MNQHKQGTVARYDGGLQMCSLAERCGLSTYQDLVLPGLCWLNCYPDLKATKQCGRSSAVIPLANALQASPFTQCLERANPNLTPSRGLYQEPAPGKDRLQFLLLAETHHRLSELVTCAWKSRLLPQWSVALLCSSLPCGQASHQLSCIHLCVDPAWLSGPALPTPLLFWGLFFTYMHSNPDRSVDRWDRRPLKREENSSLISQLTWAGLCTSHFASIIPFKPYENLVKWLLWLRY